MKKRKSKEFNVNIIWKAEVHTCSDLFILKFSVNTLFFAHPLVKLCGLFVCAWEWERTSIYRSAKVQSCNSHTITHIHIQYTLFQYLLCDALEKGLKEVNKHELELPPKCVGQCGVKSIKWFGVCSSNEQ